jgi:Ser-tRNA(Ala) deacylase AlaX
LPAKRSRIYARAPKTTFTQADAKNPELILKWMDENAAWLEKEGIRADKTIFFASGTMGDDGKVRDRKMADNFSAATNYEWTIFHNIFDR